MKKEGQRGNVISNGDVLVETECAISSLEKSVDVCIQTVCIRGSVCILEEVNNMQPAVVLEHEKLLPYKGTSVEITKDRSSPDVNDKDIENR